MGGDRFLLISAAQDYELAAEAVDEDGVPHGAFSLAMMKAMGQSSAAVSTGNLFAAVRNILKSNGVAQVPQIVCTDKRLDENLLGLAPGTLTNKTVVSLRTRPGNETLEISAGSGLGLRKGNEFCVVGKDGSIAGSEGLKYKENATLKLIPSDGFDPQTTFVKPKYIYAFAIERTGRMILLYPERGSGERFPSKLASGGVEKEKELGNFDIEEPVGTDNFFVLAVTEPISNPQSIFNQDGVYTSRNASLKGLLDPLINMGTRSVKLGRTETGNNWNLLRLGLRSSH